MGLTTELIPVANMLLALGFPVLVVFDRHDEEEKKYIKIMYFILGSLFIFEGYRYSKIGNEIDLLLGSKIFGIN